MTNRTVEHNATGILLQVPVITNKTAKGLRLKQEDQLAYCVALFIRRNFPDVLYRFDIAADLHTTPQVAGRMKAKYRHDTGYPDLFIPEPKAFTDSSFHGLYVELKKSKKEVFLIDGVTYRKNAHLADQVKMLNKLQDKGYFAAFGWAEDDHVFQLIADYLITGA